jgi:parvulin-like peptidyl-prolyl isomerase
MKETEQGKYWLLNKVVDQLLARQNQFLIDTYRRRMTTEKVQLDSAALMADYQTTIKDFKEPTKVHLREIVTKSAARAEQLRRWATSGRLPAMLTGRALLVTDETTLAELTLALKTAANTDSLAALFPLAFPPTAIAGTPAVNVLGKNLPDLAASAKLAGPYTSKGTYGFGFTDISKEDKLHKPELVNVSTVEQLSELLGTRSDSTAAAPSESARLGTYVRLTSTMPPSYVTGLFRLAEKDVAEAYRTQDGWLLVKITKKDTAQKAGFADIAKRFSAAGSRWSGGDLYWVARDDKSRDAKVIKAGFELPKNGISPVLKLNDSTYCFVLMEERKEAYTRPFSEVRGKIENKLHRAEEKRLADQLTSDLRGRAKIEILMKESDFVVEPLPEGTEPAETQTKPEK